MSVQTNYPLNTPFKPAAELKTSFAVNFLGTLLLIAGCMLLSVLFGTGLDFIVIAVVGIAILAVIIIFFV